MVDIDTSGPEVDVDISEDKKVEAVEQTEEPDKIEVIDKKTDEDEFTDGDSKETEKVINLVLKEKHSNGYFGKIRGGYGTGDVYDVHGNINFFRDATQLSLIGGLNNIRRSYSWYIQELQIGFR